MFGSTVLEVGIGLTFMFLLVSLLCSAMRELIEAASKSRATDLEKGIIEILGARGDPSVLEDFYKHPLISCLYRNSYTPDPAFFQGAAVASGAQPNGREFGVVGLWSELKRRQNLPTYIPSANFAVAVLSAMVPAGTASTDAKGVLSVASLRETAAKIEGNDQLRTMLLTALDGAQGDITGARKNLEAWYNASMDRVSGIYKRRTQWITFGLGLFAAVVFNIDAIRVANHLATDKTYREAIVEDAATFLKAPGADGQVASSETLKQRLDTVREQLEQSGFAIGWTCTPVALCKTADMVAADPKANLDDLRKASVGVNRPFNGPSTIGGWLVTALAVSLGAPFWFDVLNKFMVVRSTVKPAEKSGQEASKDSTSEPNLTAGKPVPVTLVVQQASPGGAGSGG
ncbi:hypothetical protein HNR00_003464 [Methylorubrum rhodinum]|uniref:Uncharacterized protein n=1 Tax=Methylorubrum rhodinum TaxID=29428 RepID=A0A840ZPC6_9HYPH|nr:hypothetical protein [Methylorubrum rhodinum]MBB5758741.1 hypothetical protein [Methylorubrum rhodinum]